MTASTFDQEKSDAFAERMLDNLNQSALALMTSIGHQVGLFDTMAQLPPATSAQIAAQAALNERYVREWLGAMVTGRVVDYHPADGTYALPPEHAAWLTRAAGVNNLAMEAQYIPLLAEVEQRIVECFRNGGGVPYSAYPRFQQIIAEDTSAGHDVSLIDTVLPLVPGLPERLRAGIQVLDVGCGSGHAINIMARAFPHSRFTGYDFSEEAVAAARAEAARMGLTNAAFAVRDAAALAGHEMYDFVTAFDAIHDQAQPAAVLRAIANALKPDGVFLMVDIAGSSRLEENLAHSFGPYLYTVSCLHCMTVSLAYDGAGLGAMWGKQTALALLSEAGFAHVDLKELEGNEFNYYYVATKAD